MNERKGWEEREESPHPYIYDQLIYILYYKVHIGYRKIDFIRTLGRERKGEEHEEKLEEEH